MLAHAMEGNFVENHFLKSVRATRLGLGLLMMLGASQLSAEPNQQQGIDLLGVNLSGAGFAPQALPGKVGQHYFYPEKKHFAYYRDQNIRLIRFPFIWERVQHDLHKGLDTAQLRLLENTLDLAQEHGQKIILDMHNYGRYQGALIGSRKVPYEAYATVWRKLAERFKDHPALHGYDIMNEPHDTAGLWPGAAQAAVDAIREVDRNTLIFVEGDRWASAYHWPKANANFLINDPTGNLIYEAHLYFDEDSSGRYRRDDYSNVDPMLGVQRARPFVEWLKKHGQKGFLGEYGVPGSSEPLLKAMENLLVYLNENCVPSAYWAGGPGWGNYDMAIEPRNGQHRPQMHVLQKHMTNDCEEYGPHP